MSQGNSHNQISMTSMADVIGKIAAFRDAALRVAKDVNIENNNEVFYDVLRTYGYSHGKYNNNYALFLDIILLLEDRLNKILSAVSIDTSYYTFWFNYNPRFFSDEKLGRIINDTELAYRICREGMSTSCDIIDSQNKDDYNVYYFRRVIERGAMIETVSKDIVSIQQILSCHKEIETLVAFKNNDDISWQIKFYGEDELREDINEVHLFDTPEQEYYYTIFLKKTFGIKVDESDLPLYLKVSNFPDEFEEGNAKYTPIALYMCNLSAPYSSTESYSGSIMFASDQQFDPIIIAREIDRIKSIVNLITDVEARFIHIRNKQLVIKEANKSAKSAIMSRNMSHNLGSHVMAYLKQHLGSVQSMLNDKILTLLFDDERDLGKKLSNVHSVEDDVALPFLVGLGQFISYLQERQDFIATIATDFIPYNSNVNFKDLIYDELNPDKRNERHTERTTSMKIDNILLGNIARSEGLGRPTSPTKKGKGESEYSDLSDIVLKFRDFDGNPVVKNTPAWTALEAMRKYNISLPGGVVGRQAIFSIVENVIRNAAKHGNWRNARKLEITFDIFPRVTWKSELLKRIILIRIIKH